MEAAVGPRGGELAARVSLEPVRPCGADTNVNSPAPAPAVPVPRLVPPGRGLGTQPAPSTCPGRSSEFLLAPRQKQR